MKRREKRKKIPFRELSPGRKILRIFGLILLALVALELVLRGIGLFVSWQTISSIPLTGDTVKSDYIVLCIGDSWTVGAREGNYPYFLHQELSQRFPGKTIKVVNLGNSGTNSSQSILRLQDYLPRYKPDLVIALTGNNDHWNLSRSSYWQFEDQELTSWSLIGAKVRIFIHSLRVYKLFKTIFYAIAGYPTPNQFFYKFPLDGVETTGKTISVINRDIFGKQLRFNLIRLVELSRHFDFRLVFQTYFHFHGYGVNEIIRDVAVSYGIPLVDNNLHIHRHIKKEDRKKYLIPDGHPNARGYRIITDNILKVLTENDLLKIR